LDEISDLRFSFIPKNSLVLLALNPAKQSNLSQTQSGSRPLLQVAHKNQTSQQPQSDLLDPVQNHLDHPSSEDPVILKKDKVCPKFPLLY